MIQLYLICTCTSFSAEAYGQMVRCCRRQPYWRKLLEHNGLLVRLLARDCRFELSLQHRTAFDLDILMRQRGIPNSTSTWLQKYCCVPHTTWPLAENGFSFPSTCVWKMCGQRIQTWCSFNGCTPALCFVPHKTMSCPSRLLSYTVKFYTANFLL